MHKITRVLVALLAMLASDAGFAQAADYPHKPIRLIVPNAGASDLIARTLGAELNELWAVPVIVDTRPGASGNIALEAAARATPDGYTLFLGTVTTNAISETTFERVLKVKPSQDLTGITNLVDIFAALVANAAFAPATVRQLIDYAKANPGKVNYASAGIGTYPHLDMLRFMRAAGFEAIHVPYKTGGAGMVTALIGGEVNIGFANLAASIAHVRSGRMRALAVTPANRVPELPNVPTMTEEGFIGIGTNAWNGVFAPARIAAPVREKIYRAVVQVMQRVEVKERFAKQLMAVSLSPSPQEYNGFVRGETLKWAEVVRQNNVTLE